MLSMLSEDLVRRGHTVTVLAAVPHFPSGRVEERYRRGVWQWSVENGVRVCRVRVPSGDRASLCHRLWTFIVYQCLSTLAGLRLKYDVVLITNPAIETFLPFIVLAWLRRKLAVFCVWDLYPEVGVQLGIFRSRVVIKLVKTLEDFCLRRARWVQTLAEGFIPNLQLRAASAERVVWIPPWLDTEFIRPMPRLDEVFVVLYAGNIGLSQGLESVLDAARQLAADASIRFVLVGDGPARTGLEALAAEMGLSNVTFLPFQPRERLPEVLASADLALVSLLAGIGTGSLPSKTYTYLASGRAILAITDEGSELWRLIERSQGGRCIRSGEPNSLAASVLDLKENPKILEEMGWNGRQYVVAHHSRQSACEKFEMLLSAALEKKPA